MSRVRKIVRIDEEKCDGCGRCIPACAEGALQIIDGKARLVKEIYCDGLGACLGTCPRDAITIEEREAEPFDEDAAKQHAAATAEPPAPACPGMALRAFNEGRPSVPPDASPGETPPPPSRLGHWPVQLRLVPPFAPFLRRADLVVCADCVPFAVPDFHDRYLAGRAVVVGCPKLDDLAYYRQKLEAIFAEARPVRITVLRMEVPCCSALASAAVEARDAAAPDVPLEIHVCGIRGDVTRRAASPDTAAPKGRNHT